MVRLILFHLLPQRIILSAHVCGKRRKIASERVDNCAKGAALMTGTRVEIEHVTCNKEMKTNRVLAETFYEEMKKIPTPVYTEDEIAFAAEISKEAGFENHGGIFHRP